jgi:hypothetical protein
VRWACGKERIMNEQAVIRYHLSHRGRKDSLRQGGNGKREQFGLGFVSPTDLELFDVDEEGRVSLDATTAPKEFEADNKHHYEAVAGAPTLMVLWDVVPTWGELLRFARWSRDIREQQELERGVELQLEEAEKDRVAYAFLADPNARAEKITEDHITIAGHDFWSTEERVVVEARARSARDIEELKKANRATLAEWTGKYGTDNQRQRLAAGLLPWKEVYEAAEEHLYGPLAAFPPYKRFEIEEVCECLRGSLDDACKVKFQSVDATELTAEEWEGYSRIQAAVPDATFQLREHRAQCVTAFDPKIRRGVIVKFTMGQLSFKREFALGGPHDASGI